MEDRFPVAVKQSRLDKVEKSVADNMQTKWGITDVTVKHSRMADKIIVTTKEHSSIQLSELNDIANAVEESVHSGVSSPWIAVGEVKGPMGGPRPFANGE